MTIGQASETSVLGGENRISPKNYLNNTENPDNQEKTDVVIIAFDNWGKHWNKGYSVGKSKLERFGQNKNINILKTKIIQKIRPGFVRFGLFRLG